MLHTPTVTDAAEKRAATDAAYAASVVVIAIMAFAVAAPWYLATAAGVGTWIVTVSYAAIRSALRDEKARRS